MRPLGTLDSDFPPYHQGKFLFFSTGPQRALTVTVTGGAAAAREPRSRAAGRTDKNRGALFAGEPQRRTVVVFRCAQPVAARVSA